jgi:uncharacterized protein (DUF1330 family)
MIKNILNPTGDQVRDMRDRATGEPIYMLNLLTFKDKAVYEDGRETDLSGRDAYMLYSKGFARLMNPKGVTQVFSGEVRGALIGEGEMPWHAMAVVMYPEAQVMLDMLRDPDYHALLPHRHAGLEGQLLIECGKDDALFK